MVKATVPQRRLVPDGDYDAAFMGLEERTGERPFWFWTFAVKVNADGQSVNLTAVSSPKLSKKAKARPWVEALVKHPLRPLDHVDFNDLIGTACRVRVEIAEMDDGEPVNRIAAVMPTV